MLFVSHNGNWTEADQGLMTCISQQKNWQQKDCPEFRFDLTEIQEALVEFEERIHLTGKEFNALPEKTRHVTCSA